MKLFQTYCFLSALCAAHNNDGESGVCPHPEQNKRFVLSDATRIIGDEASMPAAQYLAGYAVVRIDIMHPATENVIRLRTDASLSDEAFSLKITPEQIDIRGGGYGGVFNGVQALLRLMPPEVYAHTLAERVELECMDFTDQPRFAYRGMLLDVVRTWMEMDQVKRYIDLYAYHNINKLHLHLTDDEGWRIEIKSHPEPARVGGFRGGDSPVRAVYGKWGEKYGGYYTQDQIRELIAYAAQRNMEIIPEIDLPGHSRTIASIHPEIRCNFQPDTAPANGYDYRSAWCVAREENYALLDDILGEICALFPSKYVHVGGDEVDLSQWEQCPDCRALMKREGMTEVIELEDYFMARVIEILAAHGKRPAVWNEAVRTGSLTRKSLVYGWENVQACRDAAAKGYRTVVMPGQYFYFDMRQSPHEDGHDWGAIFDARKIYEFDFAKEGFTDKELENVIGLEGSFFSEAYVSHEPERPDYMDYMLFPRLCALARIAWRGNAEGWDAFYKELTSAHYDRMAAMGIRFRLFPPRVTYADGRLTATTDDRSTIFYHKGESTEEHRYEESIATDKPHLYHFFSRYKTAHSPYVADESYYRTITPTLKITTSMGEDSALPLSKAARYEGSSHTARACRQGDWVLYEFDEPVVCRELFIRTGNLQLPKTIITTGYAEVSYDGAKFERVGDLEMGCITLHPSQAVKAVRLISTCDDNGTPWVSIQPPQVKPVL